jgi:hypothetical protein
MKYFIGFLASIGLIILVVFLVIRGFSGSDKPTLTEKPLVSYATTDTTVRLSVDGPIVADQEHNGYSITVGRDQTVMDTYTGYEEQVIESNTYTNNTEGYANFLRALDLAGFTLGDKKSEADPRGTCATGNRYRLEIINGTNQVQDYWTTSCKIKGTFYGDKDQVMRLFRYQAPDYSRMLRGLNI